MKNLSNREFLVVGISEIEPFMFDKIKNRKLSALFKPDGGLWASDFKKDSYYKSDWVRFCCSEDIDWLDRNCVKFKLKDDARILVIDNPQSVSYVANRYRRELVLPKHLKRVQFLYRDVYINFELLARDYDGIYVDYKWFKRFRSEECSNKDYRDLFNLWDVNSLLLFNLDCIDESEYYELNVEELKDTRLNA